MPHQRGQHIIQTFTYHHLWPWSLLSILGQNKKSQHTHGAPNTARGRLSIHVLLCLTLQLLIWPMILVCGDYMTIYMCLPCDWSLCRKHTYPECKTSGKLLCLKNYSKIVLWKTEGFVMVTHISVFFQIHIEWNIAKYLNSLQSSCVMWYPNIVI